MGLISCNNLPHYLFPSTKYLRPSKDEIEQHQSEMVIKYEQWKSKSCIATMETDKQSELSETASPLASGTSTPAPDNVTLPDMPEFDDDDDDIDIVALPGMGMGTTNDNEPQQSSDDDKAMTNLKRSVDEMEEDKAKDSTPPIKKQKLNEENSNVNAKVEKVEEEINLDQIKQSHPYFKQINFDQKFDNSPTFEYATKLFRRSQAFVSWEECVNDLTATASHVVNTCMDKTWKGKLKKVLSNEKYGWNGTYQVALSKKLLFDLAHDIAFNYMTHQREKKEKRKQLLLNCKLE